MAEGFYVGIEGAAFQEKQAIAASGGAGDASKLVRLDATGRLDISMMPVGVGGSDTITRDAFEDLNAGDVVAIFNNASSPEARKSDASNPAFPAMGFVINNYTAGNPATIYFSRVITGLAGLSIGSRYFLSETPGAITATEITTSGSLLQPVGHAVAADELAFEPAAGVIRA